MNFEDFDNKEDAIEFLKEFEDVNELLKTMKQVSGTERANVIYAVVNIAFLRVINAEDALDDIPNFEEKVKNEVDEMDPIMGYSHSDIKDFDEGVDMVVSAIAKVTGQ